MEIYLTLIITAGVAIVVIAAAQFALVVGIKVFKWGGRAVGGGLLLRVPSKNQFLVMLRTR